MEKEYEDVANDDIEPFNGTGRLWPPLGY